jgi:hypothetical protein
MNVIYRFLSHSGPRGQGAAVLGDYRRRLRRLLRRHRHAQRIVWQVARAFPTRYAGNAWPCCLRRLIKKPTRALPLRSTNQPRSLRPTAAGCFYSNALGGLKCYENPKSKVTAVPANEEEICGATFEVTEIG